MTNLEKKIEQCIQPIIEDQLAYELYDVLYVKEGKDYYLRILIDSPHGDGISLDDCEKVNNAITDLLDEKDFIKQAYYLEVSSSGLERNLRSNKHFQKYLGQQVEVKLYQNIQNTKVLQGILADYQDDHITIQLEQETIEIPKNNIANVKTIYQW